MEFPGGLAVKDLHYYCCGLGSTPSLGISACHGQGQKTKQNKTKKQKKNPQKNKTKQTKTPSKTAEN